MALHVEDELALAADPRLRELRVERRFGFELEKSAALPAAALAALNASSVLAAPQAETRKSRRLTPKRFAFWLAASCARRFAARLAGESGTGTNSPFEVVSSLIGSRVPSGSITCFMELSIDQDATGGELW